MAPLHKLSAKKDKLLLKETPLMQIQLFRQRNIQAKVNKAPIYQWWNNLDREKNQAIFSKRQANY